MSRMTRPEMFTGMGAVYGRLVTSRSVGERGDLEFHRRGCL